MSRADDPNRPDQETPAERESRLDAVVAGYFESCERGDPPSLEELPKLHPDLASELIDFQKSFGFFDQAVAPLRALAAPLRAFGDFELLSELGRGGMGIVYKARDRRLNRLVALKMIRAGDRAAPTEIQRFRNEAEAAAHLDHPHIVRIYFVGEIEGHLCFSMQLMDGGSLANHADPYRQDARAAAELAASVARAIDHAHQHGILHRDLKPSNILLDLAGQPHVADFGLAKWLGVGESLTVTGDMLGTPAYMAPELTTGRKGAATTAADIYGIGAILYFLLTGRAPITAATALEALELIRTQKPDPPSLFRLGLDPDLEIICLKCLEKDPIDRYTTAAAIAEDLQRWLEHRPILARRPNLAQRAVKLARRHRQYLWVATGVLLSVVLGLSAAVILIALARAEAVSQRDNAVRQEALARDSLERERRYDYASDIQLAARSIKTGFMQQVPDLLNRHVLADGEADWRGFDWYFLKRQAEGGQNVIASGDLKCGGIDCVIFSQDGSHLIAGTGNGPILIWDARTRKLLQRLEGHQKCVTCVALSPDGQYLASASMDHTVRIWNLGSGIAEKVLTESRDEVIQVAFSPEGGIVAAGCAHGDIFVWETKSGRHLRTMYTARHKIEQLDFLPHSQSQTLVVATGSSGSIQFWPLTADHPERELKFPFWVYSFAIDRQVENIAVGGYQALHICSLHSSKSSSWPVADHNEVQSLAFSPDGKTLAAGRQQGWIDLFEYPSGKLRQRLLQPGIIWHLAYSPSEPVLASCSQFGTIRLWRSEPEPGRVRDLGVFTGDSRSAKFSRDGRFLVYGTSNQLARLFDLAKPGGQPLWTIPCQAIIDFTPDGQQLLCFGANAIELRKLLTGELIRSWSPETLNVSEGWMSSPEVSFLHLLENEPGKPADSDGFRLKALFWNDREKRPEVLSRTTRLSPLEGCFRGTEFCCKANEAVVCCDARTGSYSRKFAMPGHLLNGFDVGGAGPYLVATRSSGTISIFDFSTGKLRSEAPAHTGWGGPVRFTPDGSTLVTGGAAPELIFWDVALGRELFREMHDSCTKTIGFSPDGRFLADCFDLGDGRSDVLIYSGEPVEPIKP